MTRDLAPPASIMKKADPGRIIQRRRRIMRRGGGLLSSPASSPFPNSPSLLLILLFCCCCCCCLSGAAAPLSTRLPLVPRFVSDSSSSSLPSSATASTSPSPSAATLPSSSSAAAPGGGEEKKEGKKRKLPQAPWSPKVKAWTQRIQGDALQTWERIKVKPSSLLQVGKDKTKVNNLTTQEEYTGSRTLRMLEFWRRSFAIYSSYKMAQARIGLQAAMLKAETPEEKEKQVEVWWDEVHERNSDKMLDLCLTMRGFFLKAGQFLGCRPDFMPLQYILKLSQLHDRVPAIPEEHIKQVLEEELGRPFEEVFSFLNLKNPVGCASICQVHEGRLRENNEKVAVKIQYPNVETVMRADLTNLQTLCGFLQKCELKFDLNSMCVELQKQIAQEFDFRKEAHSLRTVGPKLEKAYPSISVPKPFLATRRLLVMSFLDGVTLTRLEEEETGRLKKSKRQWAKRVLTLGMAGRNEGKGGAAAGGGMLGERLKRKLGKQIIEKMAHAWGFMLWNCDCIQADAHPGNLLIMKGLRLGILDWGQTKTLEPQLKRQLARLLVEMGKEDNDERIKREFYRLGVVTEKESDAKTVSKMVFSMFSTEQIEDFCDNPFSKDHGLNHNAVLSFPSELCYILRTIQIIRGLSVGLGVDFSLMKTWSPMAQGYLDREKEAQIAKEQEVIDFNRKVTI